MHQPTTVSPRSARPVKWRLFRTRLAPLHVLCSCSSTKRRFSANTKKKRSASSAAAGHRNVTASATARGVP
jgi:hypothetical protein